MGKIVVIFILLLSILSYKRRKHWYAPDVIFLSLWTFIIYMSSLHLFGFFEVSNKTYLIALIGCLSYYFGVCKSDKIKLRNVSTRFKFDFLFTKKFFLIATLFLIILDFSTFVKTFILVQSGFDLSEIREDFFSQSKSITNVLVSTLKSLVEPIVKVSGIILILQDIKKNFLCLFALVILELMQSMISGGRFGIAHMIIEFCVCYSLMRRSFPGSIKISKSFIYIAVVIFSLIILGTTLMRGIESSEIYSHFYAYLCGNMVFFDLRLPLIEKLPWQPFTTALWGFWCQILPLLNALGFPYPYWYLSVGNTVMNTQESSYIGTETIFNAFTTPFYHLYADARWVGVIFGMFIFGCFAGLVYKRAILTSNKESIVLYVIVSQMIFMTIFSYPFVNTGYMLVVLFYLFTKRLL